MLIKNIKWDTDGDMEALASLPTEVYTPPFLKEEQYEKKTGDPRPGGRYGKVANGRALRRGRGVPCGYELRHALVCGQLCTRVAAQGCEVRA